MLLVFKYFGVLTPLTEIKQSRLTLPADDHSLVLWLYNSTLWQQARTIMP